MATNLSFGDKAQLILTNKATVRVYPQEIADRVRAILALRHGRTVAFGDYYTTEVNRLTVLEKRNGAGEDEAKYQAMWIKRLDYLRGIRYFADCHGTTRPLEILEMEAYQLGQFGQLLALKTLIFQLVPEWHRLKKFEYDRKHARLVSVFESDLEWIWGDDNWPSGRRQRLNMMVNFAWEVWHKLQPVYGWCKERGCNNSLLAEGHEYCPEHFKAHQNSHQEDAYWLSEVSGRGNDRYAVLTQTGVDPEEEETQNSNGQGKKFKRQSGIPADDTIFDRTVAFGEKRRQPQPA
jgi:hypothetical protein